MLQNMIFGWDVSGSHATELHSFLPSEDSITLNLECLWDIEEISTTALTAQSKCESLFQKSVCHVF